MLAHPRRVSQVVAVSRIELAAGLRKKQQRKKQGAARGKKRNRICMRGEVLITRASSCPVVACPLLLYERIIIGRSACADAHAEFLSRRALLSAFRAVTRAEDDERLRGIETPHARCIARWTIATGQSER